MNRTIAFLVFVSALAPAPRAFAVGESVDGFPSYAERVQHELTNRARVDPQFEMTACGANCGEAACYTPQPPLRYKAALNRSARFHAAHLNKNGYFAFNSSCQLVSNIADIFPSQCDGSASCSCVGGVQSCPCTAFDQRIGLFGSSASGSLLASAAGPEQAFYLMLFAPSASSTCSFSVENSSRFQLLTSSGGIGFGAEGGDFVGDLASGGDEYEIASGSHWPRQAESVEAWANFSDVAAPNASLINVDGACTPMSLQRGTPANGAYRATLSGVGSGCHRYYFVFADSTDAIVTYPETGSLGIGPEGSCSDFSIDRQPLGAGCAVPEPAGAACTAAALATLALLAGAHTNSARR